MGKNIVIAFVSTFSRLEKKDYSYSQDGETRSVSGMLTNEAPIKFFLREYPAIDQMICLVSGGANNPPVWNPKNSSGFFNVASEEEMLEKTGGLSPYQYLEAQIRDFAKDKELKFIPISYDEKTDDYFSEKILPEILKQIHAGDTIYLETTGGFRINVTQMMLLTRILQFQGTQLACAVYSDLNKGKIFDVTDSYRDFDLVNGLNEFSSTGATGLLESYFKQGSAATGTAQKLIDAMRKLTETIMLARISKVDERKSEVEILLQQAERELEKETSGTSILTVLLPIFRSKYSQISTTPDLIKWCASNNLIQLAFTLYKDWIPKYLIKDSGIITLTNISFEYYENNCRTYTPNVYCWLFETKYVKNQSKESESTKEMNETDHYVRIIKKIKDLMQEYQAQIEYMDGIKYQDMVKLLRNYSYASLIRNKMNHALGDADSASFVAERESYLCGLRSAKYIVDEDRLDVSYLKEFLISAMDQILDLANR